MIEYKVGDRVLYRVCKYEIIFVSRMNEIMINVLGYNKWVCYSEIKPILKVKNGGRMGYKDSQLRAWFNCNVCNTEWILTLDSNKRMGTQNSVGDYECLYCGEKQTYFIGWDDD